MNKVDYLCTPISKWNKKIIAMSRICEISGKKAMVGNHVSFSNKKNKRKFNVNLMRKKFFVPSKNEWITLRVSAYALKTIDKKGIEVVLSEAKANGNTLI